MDVREQILNSEIHHLGQMVQIISYELAILNDFLREQFGPQYENYRSTHAMAVNCAPVSVTPSQGKQNPNHVSTKSKRIISTTSTKSTSAAGTEGDSQMERVEETENERQDFDAAFGDGFENEMEDDDFVNPDNLPENVDLPDGSVIIDPLEESTRRKRKAIWGKFIIAKTPNNKLIAKCPTCLNLVSNKVERLENHYLKCIKGGIRTSTPQAISLKPTTELLSARGKMKPKIKRESSGERGRSSDHVWSYFDITENAEPGKTWKRKVVKCQRCFKEVSPKVERVRKHFMLCYQIASENDDDGGGANTEGNPLNQSISHKSEGMEMDNDNDPSME